MPAITLNETLKHENARLRGRVAELEVLLGELVKGQEWMRNQYGGWLENGFPALDRAKRALAVHKEAEGK